MTDKETKKRVAHIRSLRATGASTLFGIVAGILTSLVASGPSDILSIVPLIAGLLSGLFVMQILGVNVSEFSTKDHLYVAFMTFTMWFITWTLLLTTNASL
jgi:hypothetical protein|tara:strand:+ start:321 stop:623 length:303 start_codon:yes stop_codon:yes gene_type:complete